MVDYSCAIKLSTPICVISFDNRSRDEVLKISACLEEHFPHSVAKAIVKQAEEQKAAIHLESEGHSAVYLAIGGKLAGMICVEDPVRLDARDTIEELRTLGLANIIMLTGDGEAAAKAACEALGIKQYYAQVLPENKVDVSIAMKDGSDIAKEVADITLLSENLDGLITIRRLSQELFARIHKNYRFIIGVNTSLLLLRIGGVIQPSASAVLHNTSTMMLSGMSMRRYLTDHGEDS